MIETIASNIIHVYTLTTQVECSVDDALRGLQFEDTARQLIEYLQSNTQHF